MSQTSTLLPLSKVNRLPYTCLAKDLRNRRTFRALLRDERLLRLRELRCIYRYQLLTQPRDAKLELQPQTNKF